MAAENALRALAGTMVLASLVLGITIHQAFFFIAGFVGINLLQSAFTGFCPAERILVRLGATPCRK